MPLLPCVAQDEVVADVPDRMADDFVSVGLLIADRGEVLYSILGHAALHMQCPYYGLDYVYTYESEDVQGKVWRFLMNDLRMGMVAMPLSDYLESYRREGRGVSEYSLNLPPMVKTELWRVLDDKVAEGMELQYDYINRGCAISVVNSVNEAVKSTHKYNILYPEWDESFDRSLGEIVYDDAPHSWQIFVISTMVGGVVLNPNIPKEEKLVLPKDVVKVWSKTTISGVTIISDAPKELLPSLKEYQGDMFTPMHAALLLLLLVIISVFIKTDVVDWLVWVIYILLSLFVLWMVFSPLPGTGMTPLIILFNLLPIIFWKWRKKWGIWFMALSVVWCVVMLCAPHRLVDGTYIVLALVYALSAAKQSDICKFV